MAKGVLVTADNVYAVADRLAQHGRAPTLRAVRRELGGGSFGSILPFLQNWRRSNADCEAAEVVPAESEMDPRLAGALDRLFSAASDVAEAIQESLTPASGQKADISPEVRQELLALQKIAMEQIGKLRHERDDLHNQLSEAQEELEELRAWRQRAVQHMRKVTPTLVKKSA